MKKIHALYFGYAGAILSAVVMLLLGILGNLGIYTRGVEAMTQWHLLFSLSFAGIIGGMIEGAISSFVLLYVFARVYNWLLESRNKHE